MLFASNAVDYEKNGKKGVKRMNQTSDANVKEHRTQAKRCFKTHHSRIDKATIRLGRVCPGLSGFCNRFSVLNHDFSGLTPPATVFCHHSIFDDENRSSIKSYDTPPHSDL
jgi:hypothetical protein